ncbi:MAG: acyl-CoA/acyl-ACP dehydrogenase [Emcibacter sp.]|nr:acyl-CoA/acyl-ACP dehydrogenase [Emcibacter sp.]
MDVEFSEQQRLIQDSARSFLSANFTRQLVCDARTAPEGCSPQNWADMSDLGWMAIRVPESYDGIDGSFVDLLVLLEEMGRVALPGPFFPTAVYGVEILRECENQQIKEDIFPSVASGQIKLAVALNNDDGEFGPSAVCFTASPGDNGYLLNGASHYVQNGHNADYILCAARMGQCEEPEKDIALFRVATDMPGLCRKPLVTVNGICASEVVLENVHAGSADLISEGMTLWPLLEQATFRSAVAKSAEMVGAAARILEIAVAHAKERHQFGQAIGSFQAIQHHCADMLTDLDSARWMMYKTGWLIDEGRATRQDMAMTKIWCNEACRRILRSGHQVMGGIGYCEEHDMPMFFRYLRLAESSLGGTDDHLAVVADDLLSEEPSMISGNKKD